ncbi:MAG: AMP-binding protein [Bacteroidales bacterium]|nr:AMP-binding protein [Bacteroidales bacterium]MBQ4221235.1 AMP-binding protein [Bacteroidales bacterium]
MYPLTKKDDFICVFEQSMKECWDKTALVEFQNPGLTYGGLAAEIEKNLLCWKAAGLKPGDKIALNARSSAAWGITYFSSQIGRYVAVQIFNGFMPSDAQGLVNHSESRLLYTEKMLFAKMDFETMPNLLAAIDTHTGELLASRGDFAAIYAQRDALYAAAHPQGMRKEDVHYEARELDDLAAIMYTSGSTGNPKGVMLSVRNLSSNIQLIPHHFPYHREDNYVSVLPYAHIFGLVYDLMAPLCYGMTLCILYVPPVPANLKPALRQYKPYVFFAVPLIINKLLDESIGEFIHSQSGSAKLADYQNHPDFCDALHDIFMRALGGGCGLLITGGAAMPESLERLMLEQLKVPFVTGYGMTECAPTITLGHKETYVMKECGEPVPEGIELRIDSEDPQHIAGEVLVRGHVVFMGYYKNEAATKAVFTSDGWFRTGDLGTQDEMGRVFLVGRCKSMILSTNGQNIYPEEIEVVLNQLPYVAESLIVSRENRLIALIVPNYKLAEEQGLSKEKLKEIMDANLADINSQIPAYSEISSYALLVEPFDKTPKGSIRRFMYS